MESLIDDLAEQLLKKLEMDPTASNVVPTKKKFISLLEITKDIPHFNGSNIDPSTFLDECHKAYELIDLFRLPILGKIIYDRLCGEARQLVSQVRHDYNDIMLEIKRNYFDPNVLDWTYELINVKQEFHETPSHFGTRLLKMVAYAKETYLKILPRTLANNQMMSIKHLAYRMFTTKLTNKQLEEKLNYTIQEDTTDLECAIEVATDLYNAMNRDYSKHSEMHRNELYCPHCEGSYFHYFDCLFITNK